MEKEIRRQGEEIADRLAGTRRGADYRGLRGGLVAANAGEHRWERLHLHRGAHCHLPGGEIIDDALRNVVFRERCKLLDARGDLRQAERPGAVALAGFPRFELLFRRCVAGEHGNRVDIVGFADCVAVNWF